MAVSNEIALALGLGTTSCSRGPLAFNLGPQLTRALACSRGPMTLGLHSGLYLGALLALETSKALDLELLLAPCSIGSIWGPRALRLYGTQWIPIGS